MPTVHTDAFCRHIILYEVIIVLNDLKPDHFFANYYGFILVLLYNDHG